ncbi:uncharacterized protein LOC119077157 [Bradysia coprophila]|uniref:uncharacterized protein LOC119077157 n=1 Tax=Bradysia coprophila TaxID=38358 RepID=UPI00187D9028|nr:uncharacterized protein LOC119077157 [Bradysia coprophila]
MCHTKVFVLFALIAATHSYVLYDESYNQQQLADERKYFHDMYQYRHPEPLYVQEEPNAVQTHPRQKRQDRGSVTTTVERNRQAGTNVNVDAQARLWQSQNRQSTLDANANYQRNFGGQFGTGRPNYGAGLTFRHRF